MATRILIIISAVLCLPLLFKDESQVNPVIALYDTERLGNYHSVDEFTGEEICISRVDNFSTYNGESYTFFVDNFANVGLVTVYVKESSVHEFKSAHVTPTSVTVVDNDFSKLLRNSNVDLRIRLESSRLNRLDFTLPVETYQRVLNCGLEIK